MSNALQMEAELAFDSFRNWCAELSAQPVGVVTLEKNEDHHSQLIANRINRVRVDAPIIDRTGPKAEGVYEHINSGFHLAEGNAEHFPHMRPICRILQPRSPKHWKVNWVLFSSQKNQFRSTFSLSSTQKCRLRTEAIGPA